MKPTVDAFVHDVRLRCRSRSRHARTAALPARLESALRSEGTTFAAAVAPWLRDPDEVLLVRDLELALDLDAAASDDDIRLAFGRALGHALTVAESQSRVARFPSRAAFAASFLGELVAGRGHQWFYRALRPRDGEPVRSLVRRVLREHRGALGDVVVHLREQGALDPVLDALDVVDHWALWTVGLGVPLDDEQIRSLLADVRGRDDRRDTAMSRPSDREATNGSAPRADGGPTLRDVLRDSGTENPGAEDWCKLLERALTTAFEDDGRDASSTEGEADSEAWRTIETGVTELRSSIEAAAQAFEELGRELERELDEPVDEEQRRTVERWLDRASDGERPGERLGRLFDQLATRASAEAEAGADRDDAALRPLFSAALELLPRLGWLPGEELDPERAFHAWAKNEAPAIDWRNPASLARAVADAVRALLAHGERGASAHLESVADLDARTLSGLDWLDLSTLRRELEAISAGRPPEEPVAPSLRRLERELVAVFAAPGLGLDAARPVSAANSVRVYAALAARGNEWRNDPGVARWIRRALAHWGERRALAEGWMSATARPGPGGGEHRTTTTSVERGFRTRCAGLFLLLRPLGDLRLTALVQDGLADEEHRSAFLGALGACLAGPDDALTGGALDGALRLWAGPACPPDVPALQAGLRSVSAVTAATLETALLERLRQVRRAGSSRLRVHRVDVRCGEVLVACDGETGAITFAGPAEDASTTIARWAEQWAEVMEAPLETIVVTADLLPAAAEVGVDVTTAATEDGPAEQARLGATLDALSGDALSVIDERAPVTGSLLVAADALLGQWARWLNGFEASTVPYVLESFVRRRGRVFVDGDGIEVTLESMPLDLVIETSGHFEPFSGLPWLPARGVTFRRSS